jgi:hypothetical protein
MILTQQFDRAKDKQKSDARGLDAMRRKFRAEVLYEADVICSTLSGSGHESLEQFDFEMVVIDEAAQAIELSSLIPLKYRCKRCVMVGGRLPLRLLNNSTALSITGRSATTSSDSCVSGGQQSPLYLRSRMTSS